MTSLAVAVYLLVPSAEQKPAYPNPNLLVEVEDLAAGGFHLLDVRGKGKYEAGHIPGAVLAEPGPWSKAIAGGKADAEFWKRELAALGVTPTRPTVVYSDDARDAARVWWMLAFAGVKDARVLNGGWKAYTAAKLPEQKESVAAKAPPHDWRPATDRLADKKAVLERVGKPGTAIVDARSKEEFTGELKSAKKAGCVPGAVHLEWTELLDPKTGKFLPPDQLKKLLDDRKIDLNNPTITYCQSGGRASVLAFGLELMGAKNVRNYYASWAEWGNADDTPVETPKK